MEFLLQAQQALPGGRVELLTPVYGAPLHGEVSVFIYKFPNMC